MTPERTMAMGAGYFPGSLRQHWRRELLQVGLAAMESCWLYPWLAFVLHSDRLAQRVPFHAVLATYLVAMYLTRILNRRTISLLAQRVVTLAIALLGAFLLVKLYAYPHYRLNDVLWLRRFAREVSDIMLQIPPAMPILFAGLGLWWRGISTAQRDVGVDSAGFSLRVGIIAFLWLFLVGLLGRPIDAIPYAFAYFFLGLIVMGLARIEDISTSDVGIRSPFNVSWMGILAGAALVVTILSLLAVSLLSFRNIAAFLVLLRPAIAVLARITYPLQAVLAWLLEFVLTSLIRLFGRAFGAEGPDVTGLIRITEQLQELQQTRPIQGTMRWILQALKWSGIAVLFVGSLAALALSISRIVRDSQAGRSAEHESVFRAEAASGEAKDAVKSRWQEWYEALQAGLARLRGQEYALDSIRQIYASLVKLAAASGLPRHAAETPYEYLATLRRAFPESEEDLQLITEAYVRVHYGQRAFRRAYVQKVREAWLAIRARQEQHSHG